jgi:hypothetical protein
VSKAACRRSRWAPVKTAREKQFDVRRLVTTASGRPSTRSGQKVAQQSPRVVRGGAVEERRVRSAGLRRSKEGRLLIAVGDRRSAAGRLRCRMQRSSPRQVAQRVQKPQARREAEEEACTGPLGCGRQVTERFRGVQRRDSSARLLKGAVEMETTPNSCYLGKFWCAKNCCADKSEKETQ